jgi:phospholipid/cholesterol/gamma-HCH transport system substrate-binding protein
MERDANYVAVGAFVVLVIALGLAFVVWYSDARDAREFQPYEVYFGGSVSGLNEGSPVRYLGVDVGRVRRLSLDREKPGRVKVLVDVDSAAPVSGATRASLRLQGVTGLLYVELRQEPGAADTASLAQGEEYPVIESVTSDFDALIAGLPDLVSRIATLTDRVSLVFSDENAAAVTQTIANLRESTRDLPQTARGVAALVTELHGTADEMTKLAMSLRGTAEEARPEIRKALARFAEVAETLAGTAQRLDGFVNDSEGNLTRFTEQGLYEVEQLLREGRSAAREFRELSRSLKDNPSQLLYEPPADGLEIAQ